MFIYDRRYSGEVESTFDSAAGLLLRACRIFLANFPFLASVALIVMLPGKLLLQLLCALLGIYLSLFRETDLVALAA